MNVSRISSKHQKLIGKNCGWQEAARSEAPPGEKEAPPFSEGAAGGMIY